MTQTQQTGPAQPDKIEHADNQQKTPKRGSDQQQGKAGKDDQPGADGFRTAGASEDTYD